MREYVVVLGYGCSLTEEMKNYLKVVADYVKNNDIWYVITSGGFTERETKPNVSEAKLMRDYLISFDIPEGMILKEEKSHSTTGNLINTSQLIDSVLTRKRGVKITIFCDKIRRFKVKAEADYFYDFPVEVRGVDMNRSFKEKFYQYFIATPLEVVFFRFALLREMFQSYRFERNRGR